MSHVNNGPLPYNSLVDSNLTGFFANTRLRRQLQKSGLITKRGVIVSENMYRLNMSKKEHKQHVKDMLAQAIVHKTLDLERARQAEIRRTLEQIAKIQLVRRVRESRSRKRDEDVLPYLSSGLRLQSSLSPLAASGHSHNRGRPVSAPARKGKQPLSELSSSYEDDEYVIYLDDEGRPISPSHVETTGSRYSSRQSSDTKHVTSGDPIDNRNLASLDTVALRKYAMLMAKMEQGRGGVCSPYLIPQVPLPPKSPRGTPNPRSISRYRPRKSDSPKRPSTSLYPSERAKIYRGQPETLCEVSMHYHGSGLSLAREEMDPRHDILVEQQHCGGNTLTVYKNKLEPNSSFSFVSYRHRGYPFSLSIYIEGQLDCQVSRCCEYRHNQGGRIGGKNGHFSITNIKGAVPCYRCQVERGSKIGYQAPRPKLKRPPKSLEEVTVQHSIERKTPGKKALGEASSSQNQILVPVDNIEGQKQSDKYEDDFEASNKSSTSSSASDSDEKASKRDELHDRTKPSHLKKKRSDTSKSKDKSKTTKGDDSRARAQVVEPVKVNGKKETLAASGQKNGKDTSKVPSREVASPEAKVINKKPKKVQKEPEKIAVVSEPAAQNEDRFRRTSSSSSKSSSSTSTARRHSSGSEEKYARIRDKKLGHTPAGDQEKSANGLEVVKSVNVEVESNEPTENGSEDENEKRIKSDASAIRKQELTKELEDFKKVSRVETEGKAFEDVFDVDKEQEELPIARKEILVTRKSPGFAEEKMDNDKEIAKHEPESSVVMPRLQFIKAPITASFKHIADKEADNEEEETKHYSDVEKEEDDSEKVTKEINIKKEEEDEKNAEKGKLEEGNQITRESFMPVDKSPGSSQRRDSDTSSSSSSSLSSSSSDSSISLSARGPAILDSDLEGSVVAKLTADVHKDTENVHKDAEDVHKDTKDVHKDTENVHKDAEVVHKDTKDVHKDTEVVHKDAADIHKDTEDVTKDTEDVHKDTEVVHKDTKDIQKDTEDVHKDTKDVHKDAEDVHKDTKDIHKDTAAAVDNAQKDLALDNAPKEMSKPKHKTVAFYDDPSESGTDPSQVLDNETAAVDDFENDTAAEVSHNDAAEKILDKEVAATISQNNAFEKVSDYDATAEVSDSGLVEGFSESRSSSSSEGESRASPFESGDAVMAAVSKQQGHSGAEVKPSQQSIAEVNLFHEQEDAEAGILRQQEDAETNSLHEQVEKETKSLNEQEEKETKSLKEQADSEIKSLNKQAESETKSENEQVDSETKSLNEQVDSETKSLNEQVDSETKSLNEQAESETKSLNEQAEKEIESMHEQAESEVKLLQSRAAMHLLEKQASEEASDSSFAQTLTNRPALPAEKSDHGSDSDSASLSKSSTSSTSQEISHAQHKGEHNEDKAAEFDKANEGLSDEDVNKIIHELNESSSSPLVVNLSDNPLTSASVKSILGLLRAKPSVGTLLLRNTNLGNAGVTQLVEGILKLHEEKVETSERGELPMELRELDVSNCNFDNTGAESLATLIMSEVDIDTLNLSYNEAVTPDGWVTIANALEKNITLRVLTLNHNEIGNEGIEYITNALKENKYITTLDLNFAGFTKKGGECLMDMLKRNTTIVEMSLEGNDIPQQLLDDIQKYITLNKDIADVKAEKGSPKH